MQTNIRRRGFLGGLASLGVATALSPVFPLIHATAASAGTIDVLNLGDYPGADPTGLSDSAPAVNAWWSDLVSSTGAGRMGYIPPGDFKCHTPVSWDLQPVRTRGIIVFGAGQGISTLDFTQVTNAAVPNFEIVCSGFPDDDVFPKFRDFGVRGDSPNTVMQIGKRTFGGPINEAEFNNLYIANYRAGVPGSVALEVNYVLNSVLNLVVNGNMEGEAMRCRQLSMSKVMGSYGNARYGIRFMDGFNVGNALYNLDLENVQICWLADSGTPWNNTAIGGQWSYTQHAADFAVGNSNMLINPNVAPWPPLGTVAGFFGRKVGLSCISDIVPL